jgi:predicted small secreted protein
MKQALSFREGIYAMLNKLYQPLALSLIVVVLGLSACNTVEGMGRDLHAAGDAITGAAQKDKPK